MVLRDKEGNDLWDCDNCKAQTAEIYLTIESTKEIFNADRDITITNHDSSYGNSLRFKDKYYRETFFASVYPRNL